MDLCKTCNSSQIDRVFVNGGSIGEIRWLLNVKKYGWKGLQASAATCSLCKLVLACISEHPEYACVKDLDKLQIQLREHAMARVIITNTEGLDLETMKADDWRPYYDSSISRRTQLGEQAMARAGISASEASIDQVKDAGRDISFDRWARTVGFFSVEARNQEKVLVAEIFPVSEGAPHNKLFHIRQLTCPDDLADRIHEWHAFCTEHHQDQCRPPPLSGVVNLRMIDVVDACVVQIDRTIDYLALSYCWGGQQNFVLTKSTVDMLSKKSSMYDLRVATTISDAMLLTKRLGQRYLWVDAFCIVQDDEESKRVQIQQMNNIYKSARLTIVAAAGDGAWSGLPGVREPRPIKEFHSTIASQKVCVRYGQQSFLEALDTAWSRRAWTLQEHLLSRRLLFVTKQQFFWECEQAIFQEGLYTEHTGKLDYHNRFQDWFKPSVASELWCIPPLTAFQTYNHIMERVSRTEIGFPADLLNSMQGMLNELEAELGPFFWGMPVSTLDSALLFHAEDNKAPFPRRDMFPTWSWLGWRTVAVSDVASPSSLWALENSTERPIGRHSPPDASSVNKIVAYYRVNDEENGWTRLDSLKIAVRDPEVYKASCDKWTDMKVLFDIAKHRFAMAKLPLSHMLAFWTQSVYLKVDRSIDEDEDDLSYLRTDDSHGELAVRDADGEVACRIDLTDEYRQSHPDRLKFILVARSYARGHFCEILHVSTIDEITRRVIGVRDTVLGFDIWEKLDPQWEFVTMA